jgi:hypothetical protein
MLSSYSDVFGITHEHDGEEEVHVGDIVRMGANLYPQYAVVAIDGNKVWVRNVLNGVDGLALLSRCRRVDPQPANLALAAE